MNIVRWLEDLIPVATPPLRDRPSRAEVVLFTLLALGAFVQIPFLEGPWPVAGALIGAGLALSLIWRRVYPIVPLVGLALAALGHTIVAVVNGSAGAFPIAENVAALILMYSLARWASPRTVLGGALFLLVVLPYFTVLNPDEEAPGWIPAELGLSISLMSVAVLVRFRAWRNQQQDEHARLEERSRLAFDIHDSVAHHASAIALRSEATLNKLEPDDDLRPDLEAIRTSAASVLADMRTLVTSLRGDGTDQPAPESVSSLTDILATAEQQGLSVELTIGDDLPPLSPPTAAVINRVVQESVTNTIRHARSPTKIAVSLTHDDDSFELTILDDGDRSPPPARSGQGLGLHSMSKRVRSLDGQLTAGPNLSGGWLVTAELPANKRRR